MLQECVGDLGEELGPQRPDHVRHALRGVGVGRILLGELVRESHLLGIYMRDGEAADRTVLLHHVDRTPVREPRNCEGSDVGERPFVLERRREQLAGLRDEPVILGEALLRLVELCRSYRCRRQVAEERGGVLLGLRELLRVAVVESEGPDDTAGVAEGRDEHRARAGLGVRLAVGRAQPVGGREVFGDQQLGERHLRVPAADRCGRALDIRLR